MFAGGPVTPSGIRERHGVCHPFTPRSGEGRRKTMRIVNTRLFPGPNLHSARPALRVGIEVGSSAGGASQEVPGFLDRLLDRLPGLRQHPCSGGRPDDVLEQVVLALCRAAGVGADFVRVVPAAPGRRDILLGYDNRTVGRHLVQTAVDLVNAVAEGRPFPLDETLAEARRLVAGTELDPVTRAVVDAAERRGIPWSRVSDEGLVQLGQGKYRRLVRAAESDLTRSLAVGITRDKALTKSLLEQAAIPVPDGTVVRTAADAVEALLEDFKPPLVVKPLHGNQGRGLALGVTTPAAMSDAFARAAAISPAVLVEEQFAGREYQVLVVNGRVVAAAECVPAGGPARDVTDEVHPEVGRVCERAARVLGLDVCGFDLIAPDLAHPLPAARAGIIGVKAAPDLRLQQHPGTGRARDVGAAILDMLYPPGTPAHVPIVAVTGTNGKTTVTRMIGHVVTAAGRSAGVTTTDGITLAGARVVAGDTTGSSSARLVLSDPRVEVAVLETARGGIVRRGLGYDWSDVAVLTNIQADHLGQDGVQTLDDLLHIKALVAERVREGGTLVLNADDERLARLPQSPRLAGVHRRVVYFALSPDNPVVRRHVAAGGTACVLEQGWLVELAGDSRRRVVPEAAILVTLGGAARFQTANALAATAACLALGLAPEQIAAGLAHFQGDGHNPGRTNLYEVGRGYVVVDYGHNPGAVAALCDLAASWSDRRVTGIFSAPGDRIAELSEQVARLAARGFDRLIVREDEDCRGRQPGEMAALLARVVRQEAPEKECRIILNECEALQTALQELEDGEVVVLFYDKDPEPALEVLRRFGARPASTLRPVPGHGAPETGTAGAREVLSGTGGLSKSS
jgi:UDP-N-acetylmuramyl tripeptide synthase/D-alanine-D-alanine ligase-like ATP-grasp enzyme